MSATRRGSRTYLSCPRRTASVVQGLTTGGKCYHWNPRGRSCSPTCPPPPSRSELWGTDLGYLWKHKSSVLRSRPRQERIAVAWLARPLFSLYCRRIDRLICISGLTPFKVNVLSSYRPITLTSSLHDDGEGLTAALLTQWQLLGKRKRRAGGWEKIVSPFTTETMVGSYSPRVPPSPASLQDPNW